MPRISYNTVNSGSDPKEVIECVRNIQNGALNIGGTVIMNGTETVINDTRIGGQSVLLFMATTAAGASVVPTIWVKTRGKFFAVVDHAACTNVSLEYVVFA